MISAARCSDTKDSKWHKSDAISWRRNTKKKKERTGESGVHTTVAKKKHSWGCETEIPSGNAILNDSCQKEPMKKAPDVQRK